MTEAYDVAVVGGGIHGAGVAQAAAAAGHRVLLLEARGVASGTSSRSSKLVHGGLRYLESAQLGLIREALSEREVLRRIAPDLVRLVPFFLPVYTHTTRGALKIRVGLSLYALLGGLQKVMRYRTIPRADWGGLDGLSTRDLKAVFRYWDAQTDDAALTRAVVRSAESLGARLLCPADFLGAERGDTGYTLGFRHAGNEETAAAAVLVNAAGPWADSVAAAVTPAPPRLPVDLVQGTHIVVEGAQQRGLYYVEAPRDQRAVFIMPWHGRTLVGTTETTYTGDPAAVKPLPAEIEYLQETLVHYFPQRTGAVVDAFAGLRVLPRADGTPFGRAREVMLCTETARPPRFVTLYGGKLSTYRATAQKVLRTVRGALPARDPVADTAALRLEREP